ncbi:PAS domain-containing hybrid sensor histidine kinase/response regulator [Azohydromonas aeria]|uniref:PAS domain-containing hybrid sensor histidine kinase/response regulator n=1 Tax=Azohydromonas aeria TaxID=2590212 RepID=UPI001E5898BC|nr:ATP-binding protein [Azohydromonas aeria]
MDTSILLTTNALLSAAAAIVMLVVSRTRKTYPGFGFWTAGVAGLALGAAMLVPGALPSTWAVRVLRNAMLLGGLLLILRGMLVFRGHRVGAGLEAGLGAVFLVVFGYYSLDPAHLDQRIVVYGVMAAALSLGTVFVTLWRRPAHFCSNDVLLALWLSFYAVLNLVRIAHQLGGAAGGTAFEALKGFGSFYAMAQILTAQLVTLTLISMNSQRIEHEYRMSEARLREREEQLRSIGDNLPDGFVYQYEAVDGQRRFSYVSAGAGRIFGLQPRDIMADAQPLFAMMDPASLERYVADEARCARELSVYSGTLLFRLPGGQEAWIHARASPVRRADGMLAWQGVALDVTQRVRSEAELDRHRHHLQSMVQERTAQLLEAQLRAEAANEAKSAFLANMSHEIRTPLHGMLGMARRLQEAPLAPAQQQQVQVIERSGRLLLGVIDDVLDFSRIEAGRLELEQAPLDLVQLARDAVALFEPGAQAKGLALRLALEPGLTQAWLLGDALRLSQVLNNLLSNAVKFTARGSVVLQLSALEGGRWRVAVRDTGIGLSAADRQRIFEPFMQADSSTTRRFGGTGLGLAIVRSLVQLAGGELGVDSEPGRGTEFWFELRLPPAPAPVPEPDRAPAWPAAAPWWPRTTRSTWRWRGRSCRAWTCACRRPSTARRPCRPTARNGPTWC